MTPEAKAAFGQKMKDARAKAAALRAQAAPPQAGGQAPVNDAPAFMRETPPQPEARAQPEAKPSEAQAAKIRLDAETELAGVYAGAHFGWAFVTGIEDLQIDEASAREVSAKFIRACDAWGIKLDSAMTGRIGATLSFGIVFLIVEMQKLRIFNNVMAQRMAMARAQANATAAAPADPNAGAHMPSPGVHPTGLDAMTDRPFDIAAE
jgi:hypothetical protein